MKLIYHFVVALAKYIINGRPKVDDDEYDYRLRKCYECEYRNDNRCSICGCYISKKCKWLTEHCDKQKW